MNKVECTEDKKEYTQVTPSTRSFDTNELKETCIQVAEGIRNLCNGIRELISRITKGVGEYQCPHCDVHVFNSSENIKLDTNPHMLDGHGAYVEHVYGHLADGLHPVCFNCYKQGKEDPVLTVMKELINTLKRIFPENLKKTGMLEHVGLPEVTPENLSRMIYERDFEVCQHGLRFDTNPPVMIRFSPIHPGYTNSNTCVGRGVDDGNVKIGVIVHGDDNISFLYSHEIAESVRKAAMEKTLTASIEFEKFLFSNWKEKGIDARLHLTTDYTECKERCVDKGTDRYEVIPEDEGIYEVIPEDEEV